MYMSLKETGIFSFTFTALSGMPVNEAMSGLATPSSMGELEGNPKYAEVMDILDRSAIVQSGRWGHVYGYKQEQGGVLVQNLFPIKKHEHEQISSSSNVLLEMHTETAFHPYRPEVLILFCIRGDPAAGTNYSHLPDILEVLDDDVKFHLRQPTYTTTLDPSFIIDGYSNSVIRTSVLSANDTELIFDRDLMKGTTPAAESALVKLAEAVETTKTTIYLKEGQALALDNKTIVHGRTPFKPRYDGTDRWIKRTLVRSYPPPETDVVLRGYGKVITTDF